MISFQPFPSTPLEGFNQNKMKTSRLQKNGQQGFSFQNILFSPLPTTL